MYRLRVDQEVSARFPLYGCVVAYTSGLVNSDRSDLSEDSVKKLTGTSDEIRRRYTSEQPCVEPHIAAWRAAYSSFGAKPKKHLCSVEALISRILETGGLPSINPAVDAYNIVSLEHTIPIGGEDWNSLESDNVLRFADGLIPFETMQRGELVVEMPPAGEVVWADKKGITCRRWNWRQCRRTMITERTTDAYFVFDVLPPFSIAIALAAAEDLCRYLLSFSPSLKYTIEVVHSPRE
jgi:DNA/RNA-binding domain of Phe-tRNA-synthetase-like protein